MSPQSSAPQRMADTLCAQLESRILEGKLKPGDRLPAERELAAELGVSRPSLREAIQKLAARGMVQTRHGFGTVVTGRIQADFADPWRAMLRDHPGLEADLLELRRLIEGQAAALAAQRATPSDLSRLEAAHAALQASYENGDWPQRLERDVEFHQALAAASHNAMMGLVMGNLLQLIQGRVSENLDRVQPAQGELEKAREQHRRIWESVRARDPQAAATAAGAHVDFMQRNLEPVVQA